MKEKVDSMTAACTNADTHTDELVKDLILNYSKRILKLFKRYTSMKKKCLDNRASDPETYRLLDADSIQRQNALLSRRLSQRYAVSVMPT
jgi:hypothetical protein